jgi:hypothetical protein
MPNQQKDSKFETFYSALSGKMPLGAYYYAYANEIGEGKKEAENCLKYMDGKNFELPIFYDLEDKTMAHIDEVAREFVDTIKAAGYKVGIYCNTNWARNKVDLSKFQDCMIWLAQYGANNGNVPSEKPSLQYDIWQYTSRGSVLGMGGSVDMNIAEELQYTPKEQKEEHTEAPIVDKKMERIKNVQEWLNRAYLFNIAVDGLYGPETKSALVKALQKELNKVYGKGLAVDGIFGKNTKAAIVNYRRGATGNIVRVIQGLLICHSYNIDLDGDFRT